ncbi:MAG: hypothetical protein RQ748_12100 [Elusimicrobiales bacterium]|nr:hypothetical protein [Elusimicrobiales bacterium]
MAEDSGSIFSDLRKKIPPPVEAEKKTYNPPPPPPERAPPAPPLPPIPGAETTALKTEFLALREELKELKKISAASALPGSGEEFAFRLRRAEEMIAELRVKVEAGEEFVRAETAKAAPRNELNDMDLRVVDLIESFSRLQRTFSSGGELAARLDQAESAVAGLRDVFDGHQIRLKAELDTLAPREAVDEMRVKLMAATGALEEIKRDLERYSAEFESMTAECRKALGEMRGLAKAAEESEAADPRFEQHLAETVSKLNVRISGMETAMHAGLSELSARLKSNETCYGKMFAAAEERLEKNLEPKLKDIDGQLHWLRTNMIRLSDDYSVATERKIRALEAKYSAFETISRRMDAIDAALKDNGGIGLP